MSGRSSGIGNGSRARASRAGCSRSRTACGSAGKRHAAVRGGRGEPVDPDTLVGLRRRADDAGELALADVRRLVAELPPEQRAALMLVAVDGLSYADAAEVLGVPAGTVASRVARARLALVEALEGREVAPAAPAPALARSG